MTIDNTHRSGSADENISVDRDLCHAEQRLSHE